MSRLQRTVEVFAFIYGCWSVVATWLFRWCFRKSFVVSVPALMRLLFCSWPSSVVTLSKAAEWVLCSFGEQAGRALTNTLIQESLRSSGWCGEGPHYPECKISGQKLESDEPKDKHGIDLWWESCLSIFTASFRGIISWTFFLRFSFHCALCGALTNFSWTCFSQTLALLR